MAPYSKTIVYISTYPPRECGIATFTQDLRNSMQLLEKKVSCNVAAFNLSDVDTLKYPPEVEWIVHQYNKEEYIELAKKLNHKSKGTKIILQHEYGIFGGENGEYILDFLANTYIPVLTTLHTVLPNPNDHMKFVTEKIIDYSQKIIVLTQNSQKILETLYPRARGKTSVIPHGIHPTSFETSNKYKKKLGLTGKKIITTFGLLSRGKGLEYALDALPEVIKKHPTTLYLILGETHPVVRRQEGEAYRLMLVDKVKKNKLQKHVKFYDHYFTLPDLFEFLKATDIYVATSTDPNQSVSGTLSYALGSGRAVISTDFVQAREIVTSSVGRRIPVRDSASLCKALNEMLSNKKALSKMDRQAYKSTRHMLWSNVAKAYINELNTTTLPPIKLDHLETMTDKTGLFQFAKNDKPDPKHGYTLDDNARAAILMVRIRQDKKSLQALKLLNIYLKFIKMCQKPDGTFINYISHPHNTPSNQNLTEDLEDTQARALLALTEIMTSKALPKVQRKKAEMMFHKASKKRSPDHLRAQALTIKALSLLKNTPLYKKENYEKLIEQSAQSLTSALKKSSNKNWIWFENNLSYNNAIISEGLLIAGHTMKKRSYITKGLSTLEFLIQKTFSDTYIPIGHASWYERDKKRSRYDQQPEDPSATISALNKAYEITKETRYSTLALECFSWFQGKNTQHLSLYNPQTGGCYDGLQPGRVNTNQGAESTLAYLTSRLTVEKLTQ